MRIAVIGTGLMGSAAVYDLADDLMSPNVEALMVADLNAKRAEEVAKRASRFTECKEIEYRRLDASNVSETVDLLREFDTDVVINAALYTVIPQVMKASLEARVHYVDLGDDVDTLLMQRSMDHEFRDRGIIALPEMGGSPGLINVMARRAIDLLDQVEELVLREGWVDFNDYDALGIPLPVPYSLDTILDELEQPAEVWRDGRLEYVPPFSGREEVVFPPPVGKQEVYYVEHPEVYSLGETFRHKGLRFVDYKLSFPRDLLMKYKLLHDLGLSAQDPVRVDGREIVPRELVRSLAMSKLVEVEPKDYDVMRVLARGWKGGMRAEVVVEARLSWSERWKISAQALLVGSPASLAAQWVALGLISEPGVHYPEEVIDPIPFLDEMRRRGFEFREAVEIQL